MSRYTWVITKDCLEPLGQKNLVGKMGPRGATLTAEQVKSAVGAQHFRMKDADGEIYVEGFICGDFDGFEPKDDFGEPSLGCTDIEYLEKGKWVGL